MSGRSCHAILTIVTWNSSEYIADLFKSIKEQTFQGLHVIVIDNASTDNTLELIPQDSNVTVIKNSSNLGFSKSHNKGIEMAYKFWRDLDLFDRYIFVTNPDIVLDKNCIREMLLAMSSNKNIAMMGTKLLRIHEEETDNIIDRKKTDIVDSMGLEMYKTRKVVDRLSGKTVTSGEELQDVFGVSGALTCLRASMLEKIKYNKEYFDEDFFAYKEDVDLSWRLKNMGYGIVINPKAIAYHHRAIKQPTKNTFLKVFKNQKYKSPLIKYLSKRNHLWLILKNDFAINIFIDLPFIIAREFAKFVYSLIFDIKSLRAYGSAIVGIPKMLAKRAYLKNAVLKPEEIRRIIK